MTLNLNTVAEHRKSQRGAALSVIRVNQSVDDGFAQGHYRELRNFLVAEILDFKGVTGITLHKLNSLLDSERREVVYIC